MASTCSLVFSSHKIPVITSLFYKYRLCSFREIDNSLYSFHTNKKNSTADILDEFTVRLVNKSKIKWNPNYAAKKISTPKPVEPVDLWHLSFKYKLKQINDAKKLQLNIENLSVRQIDALITSALELGRLDEVEYLITQCITMEKCPSTEIVVMLLSKYCNNADVNMVTSLQRFFKHMNPKISTANSDFEHYVAKSHWIRGNIQKSLDIFVDIYETNENLRRTVKTLIKLLICDTIVNRSEASAVILTKYMVLFGERFDEWYPLSCFWESCWLSDWFGDQQLADSLFGDYSQLREFMTDKLVCKASIALNGHQEDAVVKLLQLTLKFDMKHISTSILQLLFNYRYKQNDFSGCIAIVRSCSPLNMSLTSSQYEKYLTMVIVNGAPSAKTPEPLHPVIPSTYELKF